MNKYKIGFLTLIFLITHSSFVQAQQLMTIEQCISMALDRNLDLEATIYNKQNADISLKQAKQSRLPNLNGLSRMSWNFGRTVDPTSNDFINTTFFSNSYSLSSDVTVYNFNRINNLIKQAKLNKSSSEKDYEQIKLDVALQVTSAYVNSLFGLENLKNAQLQLEQSEAQLNQIDVFIKNGSKPVNDRLDLVAAVAGQEQNLLNFQNQYELSLLSLKQIMKMDYDIDLQLELFTDYSINTDVDKLTISDLVSKVIHKYPALQSAVLQTDMAALQVNIAQSGLYPRLSVGGSLGSSYSNQGKSITSNGFYLEEQPIQINGQDALLGLYRPDVIIEDNPFADQIEENISYGFGVNLSIPIYNNYQSKASVQKAKISLLQSQNSYEKIKYQLIKSLQQVLADAKAAKKELAASNKSYNAMLSAYAHAEKKHEQGSISTFEYLQIKNQLDSTLLKNTIAKYNYIFKGKLLDYYLSAQ